MAKKPQQNTKSEAPPQAAIALNGSNTLPAMIPLGEDRVEVQLGEVVARAHQESGLSVEDWNALPEGERDAKLVAVIEAMHADTRMAGDGDAELNSDGPGDAAPGGEILAGQALDMDKEPEGGWCYPVLTPTKFRGALIKPPAFIQLTAQEAAPYLAANVVGDDVSFPPTAD